MVTTNGSTQMNIKPDIHQNKIDVFKKSNRKFENTVHVLYTHVPLDGSKDWRMYVQEHTCNFKHYAGLAKFYGETAWPDS